MDDGPDVTDEETGQEDLGDADAESVALEVGAAAVGAGRDAGRGASADTSADTS